MFTFLGILTGLVVASLVLGAFSRMPEGVQITISLALWVPVIWVVWSATHQPAQVEGFTEKSFGGAHYSPRAELARSPNR